MKIYLLVILVLLASDVVVRVVKLKNGDLNRTAGEVAFDAVCNLLMLVWGVVIAAEAGYFGGAL